MSMTVSDTTNLDELSSYDRAQPSKNQYQQNSVQRHGGPKQGPCNNLKIFVFDHIRDLRSDWLRLEQGAHVSVHQTYDWCETWCRHRGKKTLFIALKQGAQIEMILPLEITRKFGGQLAQLIGTDQSNGNFILASPGFIENCDQHFLNWFCDQLILMKLPIDMILLDRMRAIFGSMENPFLQLPAVINQNPSFQLPLKPDFDETLKQLSAKNRRKKYRNSANKLEKLGGFAHVIATSGHDIDHALRQFYEHKAKRFDSQGLPDAFADQALKDTIARLAHLNANSASRMHLHCLKMNEGADQDRIIAITSTTQKNGHTICHFNAFDADFAAKTNSSPSLLLFYTIMEHSIQNGGQLFDLGIGDQRYKRSLTSIETEHYDVHIKLTVKGALLSLAMKAQTITKRIVKSSIFLTSFANKLRAHEMHHPSSS